MRKIKYLYQDEKELIFKIDNNIYQLSKTDENDYCLSVIDSIDEIPQVDKYFNEGEEICRYIGYLMFK